jgi:hypothetical protein
MQLRQGLAFWFLYAPGGTCLFIGSMLPNTVAALIGLGMVITGLLIAIDWAAPRE